MTLLSDAARLLDMAARAISEEHARLMRALANELVAAAHAEAEIVDARVALKVA